MTKSVKKSHTSSRKQTPKKKTEKLETQILNNLVELQKVHANLAEKFGQLSEQISALLALFEMSARAFAKHPDLQMAEKDKEFLDKIDKLLEQNKVIAKGLTLMEGKMREKVYGVPMSPPPQSRTLPKI